MARSDYGAVDAVLAAGGAMLLVDSVPRPSSHRSYVITSVGMGKKHSPGLPPAGLELMTEARGVQRHSPQ